MNFVVDYVSVCVYVCSTCLYSMTTTDRLQLIKTLTWQRYIDKWAALLCIIDEKFKGFFFSIRFHTAPGDLYFIKWVCLQWFALICRQPTTYQNTHTHKFNRSQWTSETVICNLLNVILLCCLDWNLSPTVVVVHIWFACFRTHHAGLLSLNTLHLTSHFR